MKKRVIKKLSLIGLGCVLAIGTIILTCNMLVIANANGKTFDNVSEIPQNKVGLLLATSPITPCGAHNFYFDNRIKAADELYNLARVKMFIDLSLE